MQSEYTRRVGGPDIAWAYRIIERAAAGEVVSALPLQWAREAVAKWGHNYGAPAKEAA